MNKKVSMTTLTAAVSTPDDSVAVPNRKSAASMTSLIANLEIGQCCSRVQPLPSNMTLAEYAAQGSDMREGLRAAVGASVRAAKVQTNAEYQVEVTDVITTQRSIYVLAIVTRVS